MSALRQTERPVRYPSRMAVRDGRIVRIKRCSGGCDRDLICADGPDSDFSPSRRDRATGKVVAWYAYCKRCAQRLRQEEDPERRAKRLAQRRARHAERMETDPAYRAAHLAKCAVNSKRWLEVPENREKDRESSRQYHRELRRRNSKAVNEVKRMDYRLREERKGRKVRVERTVIDGTRPYVPAGPFRDWLDAYSSETGLGSSMELALDLGINDRRIRVIRDGSSRQVALDIVDRAILNARTQVQVKGRYVFTLDDLYPLSLENTL